MRSSGDTPAGSRSWKGVDILMFFSSIELTSKLYQRIRRKEGKFQNIQKILDMKYAVKSAMVAKWLRWMCHVLHDEW